MKTILIVALIVFCGSATESASLAGNLVSTIRIVNHLCYYPNNRNNQTLIDQFFGCYDNAPGKDLFVKCQTQLFGGPLNTVPNVGTSCSQPMKLPTYASCLSSAFKQAGLDMNSAVETLNACQSAVLGIA